MRTATARKTSSAPPSRAALSIADARAVVRLVGELARLPDDRVMRSERICVGMRELMSAMVGTIAQFDNYHAGAPMPTLVWGMDFGFPSEAHRRAFFESHRDPVDGMYIVVDKMRFRADRPCVVTRDDLISDAKWYASGFFRRYASKAGVDHGITAFYPLPGRHRVIGVGLHRKLGDPAFAPRDRAMLEVLNEELGWFYETLAVPEPGARGSTAPGSRPPLRPRYARALEHLLAGQSEKQAARSMGVSRNTVHEYVKAIYRHYKVSSRPELLTRLLSAGAPNGAAKPAPRRPMAARTRAGA